MTRPPGGLVFHQRDTGVGDITAEPHNRAMSLRLFRSTGFHSILTPGETRVALHPGWAVAAVAGWIAVACNVWFWQALSGQGSLPLATLVAVAVFGAVGAVLSVFGWRRTFKPAATLALLLAALLASGTWTQSVPLERVLEGPRLLPLLPSWASLFGWQVPLLLALLGGAPVLWLWNKQLRRLSGPAQWKANVSALLLYLPLAVAAGWLLPRVAP